MLRTLPLQAEMRKKTQNVYVNARKKIKIYYGLGLH